MVEQLPTYEVFNHFRTCDAAVKFDTEYKISFGVLRYRFEFKECVF